jgi:hypothetical protein
MSKERSLVRASEIGQWAFCQRAWWLAQVKQVPHEKPAVLAYGETMHRTHGQSLWLAQSLVKLGLVLLVFALAAGLAIFVFWLLPYR